MQTRIFMRLRSRRNMYVMDRRDGYRDNRTDCNCPCEDRREKTRRMPEMLPEDMEMAWRRKASEAGKFARKSR